MDRTEKDLIERVLDGDSAAFEPLVTPYRAALIGLASRIVWNPEDAREVAQDALLKAFRYLRSCDLELGFRNWLFQIVVNSARRFRRRQAEAQRGLAGLARTGEGPARSAADPESGHERSEAKRKLRECLDTLTPREREVFWLRDIEEMNVEDTARVLRCSSISVRVNLSRARGKIRERFLQKFPELIGVGR